MQLQTSHGRDQHQATTESKDMKNLNKLKKIIGESLKSLNESKRPNFFLINNSFTQVRSNWGPVYCQNEQLTQKYRDTMQETIEISFELICRAHAFTIDSNQECRFEMFSFIFAIMQLVRSLEINEKLKHYLKSLVIMVDLFVRCDWNSNKFIKNKRKIAHEISLFVYSKIDFGSLDRLSLKNYKTSAMYYIRSLCL